MRLGDVIVHNTPAPTSTPSPKPTPRISIGDVSKTLRFFGANDWGLNTNKKRRRKGKKRKNSYFGL